MLAFGIVCAYPHRNRLVFAAEFMWVGLPLGEARAQAAPRRRARGLDCTEARAAPPDAAFDYIFLFAAAGRRSYDRHQYLNGISARGARLPLMHDCMRRGWCWSLLSEPLRTARPAAIASSLWRERA